MPFSDDFMHPKVSREFRDSNRRGRVAEPGAAPLRHGSANIPVLREAPPNAGRRLPPSDFQQLVYAVEAMRIPSDPLSADPLGGVLQIVSARAGEGVSTVASGLASRASIEGRDPVLLLDCGILAETEAAAPSTNMLGAFEVFCNGETRVASLVHKLKGYNNLMCAPLACHGVRLLGGDGARMVDFLNLLRREFALTILDCPPVLESPLSAAMSRLCDGTVLVVRAESTSHEQISAARQRIESQHGLILGAVFNDSKNHLPRFLSKRS